MNTINLLEIDNVKVKCFYCETVNTLKSTQQRNLASGKERVVINMLTATCSGCFEPLNYIVTTNNCEVIFE